MSEALHPPSTICYIRCPSVIALCQAVWIRCKVFFPAELKMHKHMGYTINWLVETGWKEVKTAAKTSDRYWRKGLSELGISSFSFLYAGLSYLPNDVYFSQKSQLLTGGPLHLKNSDIHTFSLFKSNIQIFIYIQSDDLSLIFHITSANLWVVTAFSYCSFQDASLIPVLLWSIPLTLQKSLRATKTSVLSLS